VPSAAPTPAALTVDGLEIIGVPTVRAAIDVALAERPAPRGEVVPAMLG
jgi:hypothetical protein